MDAEGSGLGTNPSNCPESKHPVREHKSEPTSLNERLLKVIVSAQTLIQFEYSYLRLSFPSDG